MAGAGDATGAGSGGGPTIVPDVDAAVRVLISGRPVCGGTLLTNSWVLTADHCFDELLALTDVSVAFGTDVDHPEQTRKALELQHFYGNTRQDKVRDLALLGVNAPFEIEGSTTRHYVPLASLSDRSLLRTYRCVGWNLSPDPASESSHLKTVQLTASAFDDTPGGQIVWWDNTDSSDPSDGTLFMPTDAGSACFWLSGPSTFLANVHIGNPMLDRQGNPNSDEQAYSLSVGAQDIQEFIAQTLFSELPLQELDIAGVAAPCSSAPDAVDLFGVRADGKVSWYRRTSAQGGWQSPASWVEQDPLEPPAGVVFSDYRPGVRCLSDGSIELILTANDGSLWWQHRAADSGNWQPSWLDASDPESAVSSGVSIVGLAPGTFDLFARGTPYDQLLHARYTGLWPAAWEDLGGGMQGAPVARMATADWIDVFMRSEDQDQVAVASGTWDAWRWYYLNQSITSEPAVASASPDHAASFGRSSTSSLMLYGYDTEWSRWVLDTGRVLPDGELTAVVREPGSLDVFVSGKSSLFWHATWPRNPTPAK